MTKTIIAVIENNKISYEIYETDISRDIEKAIDLKDGLIEIGHVDKLEFIKKIIET